MDKDVKLDVDVKPDLDRVTMAASTSEEDAWNEVLDTISKIIPLLRSRSSDTRNAAASALGALAAVLPAYKDTGGYVTTSEPLDIPSLLKSGSVLLASAGREYIAKPSAGDKAKRRKAMLGSLGLGDAVGWGDDVDKVIGDEEDTEPSAPPPPPEPQKNIFEGLSSRQIMMLKRKKGNIEEEANK